MVSYIKKVCVLGGTGFVGQAVVRQLVKAGYQVKVLTRNRERHRELLVLPPVELVNADIHERSTLKKQFADVQAVINLVGILNELDHKMRGFQTVHVKLARLLVDACQANKVTRLLHMSALNANANRGASKYLRSKGEAENIVNTTNNIDVTTFRPSAIFGPNDSFLNRFANILKYTPGFLPIPLACGKARFQPIFVEDVAQALVASLENKGSYDKRFSLCGPNQYSLQEIVAYVGALMGQLRYIIPLGEGLSKLQSLFLGQWLTLDNIRSMRVDSTCKEAFPSQQFGFQPASMETIAPRYIGMATRRISFDHIRKFAGRDGG